MTQSIPTFIECPYCGGAGGTSDSQCEECGGEGEIHIKDYADARGWTKEDAYNQLRSEGGDLDDEEEEDNDD